VQAHLLSEKVNYILLANLFKFGATQHGCTTNGGLKTIPLFLAAGLIDQVRIGHRGNRFALSNRIRSESPQERDDSVEVARPASSGIGLRMSLTGFRVSPARRTIAVGLAFATWCPRYRAVLWSSLKWSSFSDRRPGIVEFEVRPHRGGPDSKLEESRATRP